MRAAAPDDPRLVQCLLPRLKKLHEADAAWGAAWAAAKARGHAFETRQAYKRALGEAITRWVVTPEVPGSQGEANRLLCTAGRGSRPEEVAAALEAGAHEGDELRRLLLAATGEVEPPPSIAGAIFREYDRCWKGAATRGETTPPLVSGGGRDVPAQPEWAATLNAVSILADPEAFLRAGDPAWGGLETVHTAAAGDVTLVLLGGAGRCHQQGEDASGDVMAYRVEGEGPLEAVSFQPSEALASSLPRGLRVDGDAFVVDGPVGEERYWLEEASAGCVPARGPRWTLSPRAPERSSGGPLGLRRARLEAGRRP